MAQQVKVSAARTYVMVGDSQLQSYVCAGGTLPSFPATPELSI